VFSGSLARIGTYGDDRLAKGAYQLDGSFTVKPFWFAAGTVLAVGIAAWRGLPRVCAVLSIAAAVVCGVGGIAVRKTGFLAPLGGLTELAFLALLCRSWPRR
jgi:hypothetical protein